MMRFEPTLKINRLVVLKERNFVYDETFHSGVNIIRGEKNAVGKSTIANMIFYVLGGENVEWVEAARPCNEVIAEIEINGTEIIIKREISDQKERPMSFFWGNYSKAEKSSPSDWQKYSFSQKGDIQSFSQVLFRMLGIPEVRGELTARLTMNQLLRLMYADQLTSSEEMFRHEDWTRKDTREAVGSLLCGIYDERIYEIAFGIQNRQTERDEIKGQLKALWKLLGGTDQAAGLEILKEQLTNSRSELKEEYQKLNTNRTGKIAPKDIDKEKQKEIKSTANKLSKTKESIHKLKNELQSLDFEIEDSEQFIEALEKNRDALNESEIVSSVLGKAQFELCPACFTRITDENRSDVCPLCKSAKPEHDNKVQLLRLKQEMELQIEESRRLQNERNKRYNEIKEELPQLRSKQRLLMIRYNDLATSVTTNQEDAIAGSYHRIGYLTRKIEDLEKQVILAESIDKLQDKHTQLVAEIDRLQQESVRLREKQRQNTEEAYKEINTILADLISQDLTDVEKAFQKPDSVEFNFRENRVCVNGRSNYAASSKVILKNCFHLALLLASTRKEFFRYPRFVLFDDIEDKGMTAERSQNFQRLICKISQKVDVEHQIIFTTSMVDPELNKSSLTVGEYYTVDKKALRIKG